MQHMLDILKTTVNASNELSGIFNIPLLRQQGPCNTSLVPACIGGLRCYMEHCTDIFPSRTKAYTFSFREIYKG